MSRTDKTIQVYLKSGTWPNYIDFGEWFICEKIETQELRLVLCTHSVDLQKPNVGLDKNIFIVFFQGELTNYLSLYQLKKHYKFEKIVEKLDIQVR